MRVLLTGGSGFLGAHCIETLIRHGHSVVFTVRSHEKGQRMLSRYSQKPASDLSYVVVKDVAIEGAFDDAVKSHPPFEAVIHTASPYHFRVTDRKKELLDPAVLGTTGILQAIKQHAPTVKHVSITSSFAAVVTVNAHQKVYDGTSWNDVTMEEALNTDLFTAWRGSKTFAEKAAWKFVEEEKPNFEISTIQPPIMYGPVVHHLDSLAQINTSNLRIRDMIQGKMRNELQPTVIVIWVDVRDVALAHVRAVEVPEAAGKRFLVTAGFYANAEIADAIGKNFPKLRDRLATDYQSDVDLSNKPFEVDNSLSRRVLGLRYRSIEESVVDTVASLEAISD